MSKKRFCELKIKSAYLYLVDGVDDDDDVPLVAGGQSLQPAGKLLQDLTGLHRQAGNRPEVLQQLRAHREAFFREQERRARGGGALGRKRLTLTVSLLMMRTGSELAERGPPTK